MCEFLSWIEKGDKTYFLTSDLIHKTPRGEMIQKRFPGEGELQGHSAIRSYFEFDGGADKDCTDFSAPNCFPDVIANAIKAGKFWSFPFPAGLLRQPLDDDYWAKVKLLNDDYWAKRHLDDGYWAKRQLLEDGYGAKRQLLDNDHWAKVKLLNDDHRAKVKSLSMAAWELFAIPQNRTKNWR